MLALEEEFDLINERFGKKGGGHGKIEWSGSTDPKGPAAKRYKGSIG